MTTLHRFPSASLALALAAIGTQTSFATPPAVLSYTVNDARDLHDATPDGVCEVEIGGGACTLRAALEEINAAGGAAHVVVGARTIILDYLLGGLQVNAGVIVTVSGVGPTSTSINGTGAGTGPIFTVSGADPTTGRRPAALRLVALTLRDGFASDGGGAVRNAGKVSVEGCRLSGNKATASGLGGPQGRGGAIFNLEGGEVDVADSTFSDNQSRGSGGAIRNDGRLDVRNSTFDGNRAEFGGGGAIANLGTAMVTTSTFSANGSAGSGTVWNAAASADSPIPGHVQISSSTFSGAFTTSNVPPATIVNDGTGIAALANSILDIAPSDGNCRGLISSLGFNLSTDASCGFTAAGDWQGAEPLLASLADNGGPTRTHLLLPGSPALDGGFCTRLDQRGYRRPTKIVGLLNARNGCDIGAVEVQRDELPR